MKQHRQKEILSILDELHYVSIKYLANHFDVSEMTIRRDINELHDEKLAIKQNAGIRKKESILSTDIKLQKNVREKMHIGKVMANMIDVNDVIFIGAGTTVYYSVKYIPDHYGAILTNSLVSFNQLNASGFENIFLTGGQFFPKTGEFFGSHAENLIDQFNIDKTFLATNGIMNENITSPNLSLARIQTKVISESKENYILADHTKFDVADSFTFTKTNLVSAIITDDNIDKNTLLKYEELTNIYN